jgi:glycosyltransferase involved in cell wall biosynthesis
MKIAYVFDRPLPARETDSEQALQTLSAFARQGAEVRLVLPARSGPTSAAALREHYQVSGDFELITTPTPVAGWPMARKWWHALHAIQLPAVRAADLVYTRNFPTLFALARGQQPFAYETYRPWADQFRVLRLPFRRAMAAPAFLGGVLHSEFARARYEALGVESERLLVAHNGHDPARFRERKSRRELRLELGLPSERPLCVYTGHINLTKGLDTVLGMARRLPHVLFVLVGSEKRGLVERMAQRHANVQLVAWQPFDRVAQYLMAADVLLQPPSRVPLKLVGNTVLPMKLFLYLAAGRPIVAPDLPDVRELLRHEENALLVPTGRDDVAAQAVARVLEQPALAESLAQAALTTAAGLTWDARARKVLDFLQQRLGTHAAQSSRDGSSRGSMLS